MTNALQQQALLEKDRETIRQGISSEALEVLKRRYGYDLPIFTSNDVMCNPCSNDVFLRQALIKDGQRQLLTFIQSCKNPQHHD